MTADENRRVRELMRPVPRPDGGTWLWPTAASVALERQLTATPREPMSAEAKARCAEVKADKQARRALRQRPKKAGVRRSVDILDMVHDLLAR